MRGILAFFMMLLMGSIGCETKVNVVNHCGDNLLDPDEACDGAAISVTNCQQLGFYVQSGSLACNPDCTIDASACSLSCGDGIISVMHGEDCEGADLAEKSCQLLGLGAGELRCSETCHFDVSRCEVQVECGDGVLASPFEACDGDELGGETCQSLGYYGGELACDEECRFALNACALQGRCGDGLVQTDVGETRDGTALGGLTCAEVAPDRPNGALACDPGCQVDATGCRASMVTFVAVPGGTFQRDADPANTSTVSAFFMSETEITREQFLTVLGTDPSNSSLSSGVQDPVQGVNWYHAIAFCNKLSLMEGLSPVYEIDGVDFSTLTWGSIPTIDNAAWNDVTVNWAADGYRLPTEMEWMWAAMGADLENPGVVNTSGHLKAFAGSTGANELGDYAWYSLNSSGTTHPVGTRMPNELGLYDLSGNVWEWCHDRHENYPPGALMDYPGGNSEGTNRVTRGGSRSNGEGGASVTFRDSKDAQYLDSVLGFRIVHR